MGFQGQRRGDIAEPRVSLEEKLGCWAFFLSFVFRFWPMKVIVKKQNKTKTTPGQAIRGSKVTSEGRSRAIGRRRPPAVAGAASELPRGSLRAVGEKHVPQSAGLEPERGAPRGSRARGLNRPATTTRRWEPRTRSRAAPGRAHPLPELPAPPVTVGESADPRHPRAPTPAAVSGEFRRPLRALGSAPRAAFRAQFPGGTRTLRFPSAPTPLPG